MTGLVRIGRSRGDELYPGNEQNWAGSGLSALR